MCSRATSLRASSAGYESLVRTLRGTGFLELDVQLAVAKVLARAKKDLLLVDGYADQTIITDYAITAPEGVQLH